MILDKEDQKPTFFFTYAQPDDLAVPSYCPGLCSGRTEFGLAHQRGVGSQALDRRQPQQQMLSKGKGRSLVTSFPNVLVGGFQLFPADLCSEKRVARRQADGLYLPTCAR